MSVQRYVTNEEAELLDLLDHIHINIPSLVNELDTAIRKGSMHPLTAASFAEEISSFQTAVERGETSPPGKVQF